MITQRELKSVLDARRRAERLSKRPEVADYLRTVEEAAAQLQGVRRRVESGEAVEPGRYHFIRDVKTSLVVSWEKFWNRMRELPALARALTRTPEAQELIRQVTERDPAAAFITSRNSVSVDVVDAGAAEPA